MRHTSGLISRRYITAQRNAAVVDAILKAGNSKDILKYISA